MLWLVVPSTTWAKNLLGKSVWEPKSRKILLASHKARPSVTTQNFWVTSARWFSPTVGGSNCRVLSQKFTTNSGRGGDRRTGVQSVCLYGAAPVAAGSSQKNGVCFWPLASFPRQWLTKTTFCLYIFFPQILLKLPRWSGHFAQYFSIFSFIFPYCSKTCPNWSRLDQTCSKLFTNV